MFIGDLYNSVTSATYYIKTITQKALSEKIWQITHKFVIALMFCHEHWPWSVRLSICSSNKHQHFIQQFTHISIPSVQSVLSSQITRRKVTTNIHRHNKCPLLVCCLLRSCAHVVHEEDNACGVGMSTVCCLKENTDCTKRSVTCEQVWYRSD